MDPKSLGNSLETAKGCVLNLERKLLRNPETKGEYDAFMEEYLKLGHMKDIGTIEGARETGYFLPHHAVYKSESTTSKTRVVFNASCKSSSGYSLNDTLMLGPVLQDDLFSILIRFRLYKYILIADISKMYRQILINPEDTCYQRILYRFTPNEPIRVYELKTLTYGTKPASFIATRCLKELALQIDKTKPELSKIITRDFFMDDLITGGDNENDLIAIRNEISAVLEGAGFPLRKWASNNKNILDLHDQQINLALDRNESDSLKTLGVYWSPGPDTIEYKSKLNSKTSRITKRLVLSYIAQIFDPLGLLGPVIVIAKIIMQELWKLKLAWDESIPSEIFTRWEKFANELPKVSQLSIPRKLVNSKNAKLELHGFSDASKLCFGVCIYLREISSDGNIHCGIICSKSRIAPLKTLSIPRLELCAALLLTELMRKVISAIESAPGFNPLSVNYYSDSTVTLAWIHSCPSRWKTFIATRIAKIHTNSSAESWFHVSTGENPADVISRGSFPGQLAGNSLWWNGPEFLRDAEFSPKPFRAGPDDVVPEAKILIVQEAHQCAHTAEPCEEFANFIFTRYSSLSKLIRIIALCKRFTTYCKNKSRRYSHVITADELKNAEMSLVKLVQSIHFKSEIKLLTNSREIAKCSKILPLSPFLDDDQILRVGGRLRNANLKFETKYPILAPKGPFCDLLIRDAHEKSLHSGMQGTLAAVRLNYWPISGRSAVRKVIRRCVLCFKHNPIRSKPKMGELPSSRVNIARPFSRVGIDFFGPFYLKEGSRKSRKIVKAYGCVFVCMPSKAVHCELVENLSSEAFIAALKRFVSRRGLPIEIFCDNATNLVGAANEMSEIIKLLKFNQNPISKEMAARGIKWSFNTPRAPHMAGLCEAAVKLFKRHIYKTMGNAKLTFGEMYTLLTEVECILNSRPLIPMSQDPNDLTYLTPGHFLIGDYLNSLPEVDLRSESVNRLSRWQYIQRLQQEFWLKWSRDYLQELQRRQKWHVHEGPTLQPGNVVLIAEDNVPSRAWKLGRILETHPGVDGAVRSATVKTASGVIKRPTVRLCVLPSEC